MEYRRESENSDEYYQEEYISDREKANLKTKKKYLMYGILLTFG